MIATNWLKVGVLIVSTLGAAAACTTRECTEEERAAEDAEDNQDCVKVVLLKKFTDSEKVEKTAPWEPGDDLIITGDVREIRVVEGADDEIQVSFRAQVDLAEDRLQQDVAATWSDLTSSLKRSGTVTTVSASHGESKANLGAKVQVALPPGFDGNIGIDIGRGLPGDLIDIDFTGTARTIRVDVDSPKGLVINDVTGLTRAEIRTRGDISLGSFSSAKLKDVTIATTIGDILVAFSSVPSAGATVTAEFGDLDISIPDTGDYTMQVQADGGVTMTGVPKSCQADDAGLKTGRSLTCNAGATGTTFRLEASQEAVIDFL